MEDIIHLLPDNIANQIAAGEVVQRPASVVKEMMENSIDAGATHIRLKVVDAGKSLVRITDDGCGMSLSDARMSFERHATSKISTAEDLFKIRTMGFRGEALASIAAIAHVEMKTRRPQDELGTLLIVEGSEIKKQEPMAMNPGTVISVKNLFYNIPARRNFLKSNPVEMKHITDEFQRMALSNPEVSMHFENNDLEMYALDKGKLSRRIVQIFGKNYQQQLIPCQEETNHVTVTGYIGKPEFAKKTRGEQYFFINNRFIRNNYLNHAVTQAYSGLLKEDYHPFYVLFIEMDPMHVDVNVHPTKTEVKFDDDRLLYGIISSAVRQSLGSFNVSPSLDFNTDVNFEHFSGTKSTSAETSREKHYSQFRNIDTDRAKNWELLYENARKEDLISDEDLRKETHGLRQTLQSSMDEVEAEQPQKLGTFRLHGKYLIRQVKTGFTMIDQKAALERIFFERYQKNIRSGTGASQSSLFPQQIMLNTSDHSLFCEIQPEIRKLGFDIEQAGKQMIVIQGVPSELAGCNEKEMFEELLEQFKQNQNQLSINLQENICRALARNAASLKCRNLPDQEADHLIDQLFACDQPNYTPGGRPTYVLISLDKIKSWFNE